MAFEPQPSHCLPPLEVAPDTFLIRAYQPAVGAPIAAPLNSLVIRSAEPVIVDTGLAVNRARWVDDVFGLVDPLEVRWIFISHDDADHTGNLAVALELCPNASVVWNWAATERHAGEIAVPPERMMWVDDGDVIDAGDRVLRAIRPPVYDSPTTRGLFDPSTGVYWASDAFATPMPVETVDSVAEMPPPMWAEGFAMFHYHGLAPWLHIVDERRYLDQVARIRSLAPSVITSAHSPVINAESVDAAIDLIAQLPNVTPPPQPDQDFLTAVITGAVPAAV